MNRNPNRGAIVEFLGDEIFAPFEVTCFEFGCRVSVSRHHDDSEAREIASAWRNGE